METKKTKPIPPGWIGGFSTSNPQFAYPDPDLSSLPMLDNMDNIDKLQRQQGVKWPEFSWETAPGLPDPLRCFQMFSPYISRIGYTDEGRVYSIICPQQGIYIDGIGTINVEVTVTGQRGWVDETTKELAADMTVVGKIWFSPSAHQSVWVKAIWSLFENNGLPFPFSKENAIVVTTHDVNDPTQPIFPVRSGLGTRFENPEFALHWDQAWAVANIDVGIGPIKSTGSSLVDDFNALVMDLFNLGSGNMLQNGNVLSWNVWFTQPGLVNIEEWRSHAERWRKSIDIDHKSPTGNGRAAMFFDGTPFSVGTDLIEAKLEEIWDWVRDHFIEIE